MRPLLLINPKGINLEWYVKNFANHLDLEYLRYLLHFVISGMSLAIEKDDKAPIEQKYYTPISSRKVIYKNKLREHIRFLGKCWIDNTNFLYRKAYSEGKCYSYTLSPNCSEKSLAIFELKDLKLVKKIRANGNYIIDKVKKANGKYHFLRKYFNNEYLTIDVDSALKLCEERYRAHNNYNKYLKECVQIVNLHNGIYRINHKPETDARIHTNLTALPKVYRRFIRYNSKQLAEVDLSNSVIYFIAMCLSYNINQSIIKNNSLLYMFTELLGDVDNKEIELFFKLAVSGEFYDYFIPEFLCYYSEEELSKEYTYFYEGTYDGSYRHNRNLAKRLLLSMLFAKKGGKLKVEQVFKIKFPTILKVIQDFKVKYGYKKLSHMVFQLESEIMLNVAGRAFNKKYYRKAPIFTLHDCLITTTDYIPQLEALMVEEFENQFGEAPKMEMKEWS